MNKEEQRPIVTMKVEVRDIEAVIAFIKEVDLEKLTTYQLEELDKVLDYKRARTRMAIYKRKPIRRLDK